jgi:hypothetical protein
MSPSMAPPDDDPFRSLDDQFDQLCRELLGHGVPPADVQALAAEILLLLWRRSGDGDPSWPLGPALDEIAARVAHHYVGRAGHAPDGG